MERIALVNFFWEYYQPEPGKRTTFCVGKYVFLSVNSLSFQRKYIRRSEVISTFSFLFLLAEGSSDYRNQRYIGDYNAYLAADGQLSPGNSGFYHSHLEPYLALRIHLRTHDNSDFEAKKVSRVEIYLRCDPNELYHQNAFDVKGTDDPTDITKAVIPSPRLVGGKYCGTFSLSVLHWKHQVHSSLCTTSNWRKGNLGSKDYTSQP